MTDDVRKQTGGYIGQSVPRREDRNLLLGKGEFVADIQLPNMVHVAFARSPPRAYPRRRPVRSTPNGSRALAASAAYPRDVSGSGPASQWGDVVGALRRFFFSHSNSECL